MCTCVCMNVCMCVGAVEKWAIAVVWERGHTYTQKKLPDPARFQALHT